MVDNRYATALVISCVLSILATVYLSVAIGTQHWYQYSSPTVRGEANVSELRSLYEEFIDGEFDEKTYSDTLFRLNGTVGLWWRCVLVPTNAQWHKEPGECAEPLTCQTSEVESSRCRSFPFSNRQACTNNQFRGQWYPLNFQNISPKMFCIFSRLSGDSII